MLPTYLVQILNRHDKHLPGAVSAEIPRIALPNEGRSEAGLTLIECLVAIIVVGVIAALVSPVLVISVATRVNSQKTEQALQIAQAEIDAVRGVVERGRLEGAEVASVLPPSTPFTGAAIQERTVNGRTFTIEYPQAILGPLGNSIVGVGSSYEDLDNGFEAREIDTTGDGTADFAVQAFRSPGQLDTNGVPVNFSMGVRVYDIQAFETGETANLSTEQARAGVLATQGERGRQPLAVLYTTISKADIANSYCDYIRFLRSTPSSVYVCD